MRAYVMRDFHDTVTLHPPAGFSLRLLDPAQNPSPAAAKGNAPKPDSAAAEGGSASPTLQLATAVQPAADLSSSAGVRSVESSSPSSGQGDDDDRSLNEDSEAAGGSANEVRTAGRAHCERGLAAPSRLPVSEAPAEASSDCLRWVPGVSLSRIVSWIVHLISLRSLKKAKKHGSWGRTGMA